MKMYSLYVQNFHSALSSLSKHMSESPAFNRFLRETCMLPKLQNLTFQAFLIMPVQRIPRYKLLLDDLVRSTPPDHPDTPLLEKALSAIADVGMFVNEQIRKHEMYMRMLDLQRQLVGYYGHLVVPARRLIKEGVVNKVGFVHVI